MYDLQSLKLSEFEAKYKKFERNLRSTESELKSETAKRQKLEKSFEKEKHEHQQKTLTLKLETEQRDKREKEVIDIGAKLTTVTKEKSDCQTNLNRLENEHKSLQDESKAQTLSIKTLEESAVECQRQQTELNEKIKSLEKENSELKNNLKHSQSDKGLIAKLEADVEQNKALYHEKSEELDELKDALMTMGIEGLKRDAKWVDSLTVEQRSVILQGILDTDIIADTLLGSTPAPTPSNP